MAGYKIRNNIDRENSWEDATNQRIYVIVDFDVLSRKMNHHEDFQ